MLIPNSKLLLNIKPKLYNASSIYECLSISGVNTKSSAKACNFNSKTAICSVYYGTDFIMNLHNATTQIHNNSGKLIDILKYINCI